MEEYNQWLKGGRMKEPQDGLSLNTHFQNNRLVFSLSSCVVPWRGSGWCSWWLCEEVRPVWAAAWVPSPDPEAWCNNLVWHGRRSCWSQWHSRVALRREKRRHEYNFCHMLVFSQSKFHAILVQHSSLTNLCGRYWKNSSTLLCCWKIFVLKK